MFKSKTLGLLKPVLLIFIFGLMPCFTLSAQSKSDLVKQIKTDFTKDSTGSLGLRAKHLAKNLNKEITSIGTIDFTGYDLKQLEDLFGKPNQITRDKDGNPDSIGYDVNRKKKFLFYIYIRDGKAYQTEYVDLY